MEKHQVAPGKKKADTQPISDFLLTMLCINASSKKQKTSGHPYRMTTCLFI